MPERVPDEMVKHLAKAAPRRSEYQWERWADGGWWKMVKGKDYEVKTESVIANVKAWAKREGFTVYTSPLQEGEGFLLRITA